MLIQEAIKLLKKNAYPEITYEVNGYSTDLAIGDTVKIYDKSFSPKLILEARVTEQHTSFTNPSQNKSVFDNFKAVDSKISQNLVDRYEAINEQTVAYDLRLNFSNGTQFVNGSGTSTITAELWKSNVQYDAILQFKSGDQLLSNGSTYTVDSTTFQQTLSVTIEAYIGSDLITSRQVTFSNVNDGSSGSTPWKAWADNSDGTVGFSLTDANKRFEGTYVGLSQSTNPSDYTWSDKSAGLLNIFFPSWLDLSKC
ncbi:hypothetical protein [Streptococcus uberis]|uniref:hypothetical protein n=1 Tax=Streptococcus uberis TaxID=1349 RepID=UPI000DFBC6D9|nr:hypothetical protein [Streptococcus uberis]SUO86327.1 phage protein [Streptococcus uberis]